MSCLNAFSNFFYFFLFYHSQNRRHSRWNLNFSINSKVIWWSVEILYWYQMKNWEAKTANIMTPSQMIWWSGSADFKEFSGIVVSCLVQVFVFFQPVSSSTQQRPAPCPEWGWDAFLTLHLDLKGCWNSDTKSAQRMKSMKCHFES